jgi:hypothetical protein
MIEPCYKGMGQVIGPLYESMGRAAAELCERYTTEELAAIRDFTARVHEMATEEARKLREAGPARTGKPAAARRK